MNIQQWNKKGAGGTEKEKRRRCIKPYFSSKTTDVWSKPRTIAYHNDDNNNNLEVDMVNKRDIR